MVTHDDGEVLYAHHGDDWVLRIEGSLRYTNANAMDRFIDQLFAERPPVTVCIDLNATTAIDSTGIGLLAKIANGMERTGRGQPIVFCNNPEITELLSSVCLDDVCRIVAGAPPIEEPVEPIPDTSPSESDLARTIVDAHRLLSSLSESNRAQFQNVVDAFSNDSAER